MKRVLIPILIIFIFISGLLIVLVQTGVSQNFLKTQSQKKDLMEKSNIHPSVIIERKQCDLDNDGDCDENDLRLFTKAMGECEDGDNYNELADADHDGCVTLVDEMILFPNTSR